MRVPKRRLAMPPRNAESNGVDNGHANPHGALRAQRAAVCFHGGLLRTTDAVQLRSRERVRNDDARVHARVERRVHLCCARFAA